MSYCGILDIQKLHYSLIIQLEALDITQSGMVKRKRHDWGKKEGNVILSNVYKWRSKEEKTAIVAEATALRRQRVSCNEK